MIRFPKGHEYASVARTLVLNLALCLIVIFPFEKAVGAEWSITTKLDQRFLVDDNPRLRSEDSETVFGSTTSPESRYRYRSPLSDINLYGRLDFSRFYEKDFNSEDQTLRLDSEFQMLRSIWGLDGRLERDSTRTTEVTDTGSFEDISTRLRYSVQPYYAYQLSQLDLLRLDLGYTRVGYDTDTLTDYTYLTFASSWLRSLTQLTSLSLRFNAAMQDTANNVESEFYGFQVGARHVFSPAIEASLSAGPRYSTRTAASLDESALGFSFAADISYRWSELTTFSASASQSVEPSGAGTSRNRLRMGFVAERRYLPRLTVALSADYQNDSDPVDDGSATDRAYFSISPSFRWQLSQEWDLSGSYRYRRQEFDNRSEAHSSAILITLNYHPIAWFINR